MREHGNKTTPIFLPADGEASWSLRPSSFSLISGITVQPENTYTQGDRSNLKNQKKKKKRMISINTSIHLPKPVSIDLTIKIQF